MGKKKSTSKRTSPGRARSKSGAGSGRSIKRAREKPSGYRRVLGDLTRLIADSRRRALATVNRELVLLYWRIGEVIVRQQEQAKWGDGVVEQLASDLGAEFPDMKGLTKDNLFRMRKFAVSCREIDGWLAGEPTQPVGVTEDAPPAGGAPTPQGPFVENDASEIVGTVSPQFPDGGQEIVGTACPRLQLTEARFSRTTPHGFGGVGDPRRAPPTSESQLRGELNFMARSNRRRELAKKLARRKKRQERIRETRERVPRPEEISVQREVEYTIHCAQQGDVHLVTLGELVLFSTETGDVWLLDAIDHRAICLARDGKPQPYHIAETSESFIIAWSDDFVVEGEQFVVHERLGRTRQLLGYPVDEIVKAIRQARGR